MKPVKLITHLKILSPQEQSLRAAHAGYIKAAQDLTGITQQIHKKFFTDKIQSIRNTLLKDRQ